MSLDITLKMKACPTCGVGEDSYWANFTHNLSRMANEAGFYRELWHPEKVGVKTAGQLVEPLRKGIEKMKADPEHYRQFDAENGWGTYDQFLPILEELLEACEKYREAEVEVDI